MRRARRYVGRPAQLGLPVGEIPGLGAVNPQVGCSGSPRVRDWLRLRGGRHPLRALGPRVRGWPALRRSAEPKSMQHEQGGDRVRRPDVAASDEVGHRLQRHPLTA